MGSSGLFASESGAEGISCGCNELGVVECEVLCGVGECKVEDGWWAAGSGAVRRRRARARVLAHATQRKKKAMKLSVSRKVHYESGPNMTPLVDVVMVILIFLMMAGSFTGAEHYLVSDVPVQAKGIGQAPPQGMLIPTKFTISVHQEGGFYVAKAGNFATVRSTDP